MRGSWWTWLSAVVAIILGLVFGWVAGMGVVHAAHAAAQCDLANLRAVEGKGFGGAHGLEFRGAA